MDIVVAGINFKTAPVELREKVAFASSSVPTALRYIGERLAGAEFALLSTCNRTELLAAGLGLAEKKRALPGIVLECAGVPVNEHSTSHFYIKENIEAAQHLMAVASSLDSMVVGEAEILGQVKEAYTLAMEAGTSGRMLHPLFQRAIGAAKRVRTETDICRGRVSVSSIAVEFAEKVFDDLSVKSVVVVGAGETAELTLRSLVASGVKRILVVNRSLDKAMALAAKFGGAAQPFETLAEHLAETDIVVSSTGAPHCVIDCDMVKKNLASRHGRPILLLDIAVPRDIDPAVGELENVYLYDIDDLQKVAEQNLARRQMAIQDAWKIIHEEALDLTLNLDGLGPRHLLKRLDEHAREITDEELEKAFADDALGSLSHGRRQKIRELVHRVTDRMLANPRDAVGEATKRRDWRRYIKIVYDLYGIGKKRGAAKPH